MENTKIEYTVKYYEWIFSVIDKELGSIFSIPKDIMEEFLVASADPQNSRHEKYQRFKNVIPLTDPSKSFDGRIKFKTNTTMMLIYRTISPISVYRFASYSDSLCLSHTIKPLYMMPHDLPKIDISDKVLNFEEIDLEEFIFNNTIMYGTGEEQFIYITNMYFKYIMMKNGFDKEELEFRISINLQDYDVSKMRGIENEYNSIL